MQHKAKWWQLYATIPLSAGLLWLDSQFNLPPQEHQLLETGIVLLSFGWMACWVHLSRTAIAKESAAHLQFLALPDRKASHNSPAPNWQNNRRGELDEQTLVSHRGRYN